MTEAAPADTAQTPLSASRPLLGSFLVAAALNDAANKILVTEFEVPAVAAIRYIIQCMLMIAIIGPRRGTHLVQTRRTGLVIVRALCLVVSTLFLGLALQHMPIAETTAIVYLSPVLVVLCARPPCLANA